MNPLPVQPLDLTPDYAGHNLPPAPPPPASLSAEPAADAADRLAAFQGGVWEWNGKPLHPFSVARFCRFVTHRIAMGAPFIHLCMRDAAAFYADAIRILWICSVSPELLALFAKDPDSMEKAIHEWAEKNAPLHTIAEANAIAIDIYDSALINQHEVRHSATDYNAPESGN